MFKFSKIHLMIFKFVFLSSCVFVHKCESSQVHTCVCGGKWLTLGISSITLYLIVETKSSSETGAHQLARLSGQQALVPYCLYKPGLEL